MPARATKPSSSVALVFLFAFSFAGVMFALVGSAPAEADQCDEERFQNVGRCAGGGGGGGESATATPTPPPTPTPDIAAERAEARRQATANVLAAIEPPEFQIWPDDTDNQVVNLMTFFYVSNGWTDYTDTVTYRTQTVTVTASPEMSHWTWNETSGDTELIPCRGRGERWTTDATTTSCGWTPLSSSSTVGDVEVSVEIEFILSSTYAASSIIFSEPSEVRTTCIAEVLTFGTNGDSTPQHNCDGGYTGGGGGGGAGGGPGPGAPIPLPTTEPEPPTTNQADSGELPVSTQQCSGEVSFTGNLIGGELDGTAGIEYIVEELPDGSKILTISLDGGASTGIGPAGLGAAVQLNDAALGAYLSGGAELVGTGGIGGEFHLAPGESVSDFLGELVLGTLATPLQPISGLGNLPFVPTIAIPEPPEPSAVFVDATVGVSAGASGVVGIGIVTASASGGGSAEVNTASKLYLDGRTSQVITYSGQVDAGAMVHAGLPLLWETDAQVSAEAQVSLTVETISDASGNEIETIVTVSYGADADANGFGSENDALSITTKQWTYDLTNPEVEAAIGALDEWASLDVGSLATNPQLPPLPSELKDLATTYSEETQQLDITEVQISAGAGIVVVGADASIGVTCFELS